MPVPSGFQGFPGGFPGTMNPAAGAWASAMASGDLHQPGVMRKGGGRNNRTGPYDRRGRPGGRNGRLSPVSGVPNMYGGRPPAGVYVPPGHPAAAMAGPGGFPDAMGGSGQDMGPREAVQGRSLKSYEDLDAVGGGGGDELNY